MARFERGVRPIGRWSTTTNRSSRSIPATMRPPVDAAGASSIDNSSGSSAGAAAPKRSEASSTSAWLTRLDFPEPETPVTVVRTPSGNADVEAAHVVARDALQFEPAARGPRRPGRDALLAEEVAPGLRFLHRLQPGGRAAVKDAAAVLARAGPDLHDPIGGAHHVHLVLDHEEGVAGGPKLPEGAEERLRVGGMQPGRRFVEHIDDAEEVGADLRREAEPLELAGRKSRRAAIGRQVAETEVEQHLDAREQVLDDALRHDRPLGMLLRDLRPLGRVRGGGRTNPRAFSGRRDISAMSRPAKVTASASGAGVCRGRAGIRR